MNNTKDQLRIGAILSYVNLALSSLIPFFYTPIMLRMLGQSEYGLYSLSMTVISYLSLLTFGFGGTIVRYITMYRASGEKKKEEEIIGFFLVVYCCIAIAIMILGNILSNNVGIIFSQGLTVAEQNKMKILMPILTFNSALSLPVSVFVSITMAHERYLFRRLVDIFMTVGIPIMNLIALYMGYASIGLALSSTVVQILMLPINAGYCLKNLNIRIRFSKLPRALIDEILRFSLFIFIGTIVDMLFWATDKVILGMFTSTVVIAVYNIGSTFNSMITSMSASLSSILTPRVTTMVIQGATKEQLTDVFIKVGRIQYYIVILAVSGFAVFGRQFINLWTGPAYKDAYCIALVTLLPLCIPLIQNTGLSILMAQNKHQFRSICYLVIAIVNVISTYLVVPQYGGIGAAVCSGISYLVGQGIIMNIYYYKVINIDIIAFWKSILHISIVPAFMALLALMALKFVSIKTWFVFFVCVIVYSIIYVVLIYRCSMNNYEKEMVNSLISKVRVRKKYK